MRLHHAANGGEPVASEAIIIAETRELVPIIVDSIDRALVGPRERSLQLQVVGWVRKNEIDASLREASEFGDAVTEENLIDRRAGAGGMNGRNPGTRDLNPGFRAGHSGTRTTHLNTYRLRN